MAANPAFLLLGRVLMGMLFLVPAIQALMAFPGSAGYFERLGFPAPQLMVVVSSVIEIGGALLLFIGWRTRWVAWLLIAFVLVATGTAHRFWQYDDAQQMNQLHHFLKNLAIVGGLLYVASFGPGPASIDKG
jgi:putative oxidoreductase